VQGIVRWCGVVKDLGKLKAEEHRRECPHDEMQNRRNIVLSRPKVGIAAQHAYPE
jgi:hypothetical protein